MLNLIPLVQNKKMLFIFILEICIYFINIKKVTKIVTIR
jgi:hypothetical protein